MFKQKKLYLSVKEAEETEKLEVTEKTHLYMRAAVVILNWNGKAFLEKYLPVLIEHTPEEVGTIYVADNGSTDGSVQMLKSCWPSVKLIEFDQNYGFTGGYNRALKQIEAEFYVLINSDIRVSKGWLSTVIDFMDNHPHVGICMPKILSESRHEQLMQSQPEQEQLKHGLQKQEALKQSQPGYEPLKQSQPGYEPLKQSQPRYEQPEHEQPEHEQPGYEQFEYAGACGGFIDRFGYPFCRGRILSKVEDDLGQYDTPMEIFWASGACMVVRSHIYNQLGGLDESFFAHMEEIDFCWRAKLMGYHAWVVPQSKVYHVGGGTLPNNSPRKLYLNYRNNLLMLYKNLPYRKGEHSTIFRRNATIFIRMCFDGLSALAYLAQGKFSFFKAVFSAHCHYRRMKKTTEISSRCISYTNSFMKHLAGVYNRSIIRCFFTGRNKFSKL